MNTFRFEVWRGNLLESVHRGRFAVVEGSRLIAAGGDAGAVTFLRSTAKPFQATTVFESGARDAYGLSAEEVAVICGSHYAEDVHVRAVESILRKAGLRPAHLRCGPHPPLSEAAAMRLARLGKKPRALHNNCSGKHAGMLAAARRLGGSLERYLSPDHPVQKANLAAVARYAGVRPRSIRLGTDGCSAPTFGIPLAAMARAFARLGGSYDVPQIPQAMMAYPHMIGHPCEELMKALPGELLGKVGAEGMYGASVVGQGIGLAVKIDDGGFRAVLPVVVAIFRKLRLFAPKKQAVLDALVDGEIRNCAGRLVGRTRAVV